MRFFLFIVFFIASVSTTAANMPDTTNAVHTDHQPSCQDKWIAGDKLQHFTTSALLVCASSAGTNKILKQPRSESIKYGAVLSFSLGIFKEYYDQHRPTNHFCWKDFVADLFGIGFGIWIMEMWR